MATLALSAFPSAQNNLGATEDLHTCSEETLIAAAKSGQREAFGELCTRNAKKVLRVTHRITRSREDAEDALQDSFLSAFLHLKDFDGRSRFATWLTRIAINAALGKLRKNRANREIPIEDDGANTRYGTNYDFPDGTPNPEDIYRQRERKEVVSVAIHGLRPRIRRVVEVCHLEEHSIKEAAKVLGISAPAVKARMFRARIALRRMRVLKSVYGSNQASAC